jgi:peptidoglycan/LPS O-acetylase OafA/YrhL
LVLGLLLRISENRFGHVLHFVSPCHLAILFALGLFLLPVPVQFAGVYPSSFPLNHPSWSLFYEILANIGHALFIRRRSQGTLVGTIFVSGIALIYSAIHLGSVGFGVNRVQLVYGFSRVLFSYSMGIFLCRVWHTGKLRVKVSPVLCGLFFLLVLVGPRSISGQMIYDLLVTMVVFPVILLVSASSQVHARLIAPFQMLGTASYAIYVLHVPLASFYSRIWLRARGVETSSDAPWPGLLFLALTIALALFIDRVYDLPVRAFLTKRFRTDRGF